MADTTYIVLRASADELGWDYVSKVANVKSADAALRAAINTVALDDRDGIYVAVPSRSWKPLSVRTETTTTLKFDQPDQPAEPADVPA
jgi:hypothetical protein